jgi:hypothetical protein
LQKLVDPGRRADGGTEQLTEPSATGHPWDDTGVTWLGCGITRCFAVERASLGQKLDGELVLNEPLENQRALRRINTGPHAPM